MSNLMLAGAGQPAPVTTTATELAARIPVPARLPERFDGELLRHLSPSSYALWVACPEAWRRRYIKGEKPPPSGSMFLGGRVDDALSDYFRRLLEHGDRLALDQVLDTYRDHWIEALDEERDKHGIDWEDELTERAAFDIGREAIGLALAELVPRLGDPVDVQRRLEFSLASGLEWSVLCYLDLETLKEDEAGERAPTVVDFKVKGSPITKEQAQRDPQAGLYLAGRWLEGQPGNELLFAQIGKPGKRRKQMSAALVSTSRSPGEMRGVVARIALAASQIAACHERYGPDQPWGFADPTSWKCSRRYCAHWASCPAAAGSSALIPSSDWSPMHDESRPLVTSGQRRGCGYRKPGGAYFAVPLGPGGRPVEEFLIDPPVVIEDAARLGLTSVGVAVFERDGVTHVVDIVGREHYPTIAEFVDEARRLGVSRRAPRTIDFAQITSESRLLLAHAHADIANAAEFPTDAACPCHVEEHLAGDFQGMCARVWWQEPLQGAQHRLALFASFSIPQIEVVSDKAGGRHVETMRLASGAGVPVIEVER